MTMNRVDNAARSPTSRGTVGTFHHQEQILVGGVATARQITTAFSGFTTDWVGCGGLTHGVLYINLTASDATTLEVQLESSPDQTLVAPMEFVEPTDTAGVRTSTPEQEQFTSANYTPGANAAIRLAFRLNGPDLFFRVKLKRTGGTSAATTAKLYWVGAMLPG